HHLLELGGDGAEHGISRERRPRLSRLAPAELLAYEIGKSVVGVDEGGDPLHRMVVVSPHLHRRGGLRRGAVEVEGEPRERVVDPVGGATDHRAIYIDDRVSALGDLPCTAGLDEIEAAEVEGAATLVVRDDREGQLAL